MRNLTTHDLIMATRVVKQLKITDEIQRIAKAAKEIKTLAQQKQFGIDLFFTVLGNLGSEEAERSLYDFLAGPFECEPEEIRNADVLDTAEKIKELVEITDIERWKGFFASLASMTK